MHSIAFIAQKGGTGKTTLTASLVVVAAAAGEKVIALDLDSQGSLVRWSERRKGANAPNTVVIEPLESERLPQLPAILEVLASFRSAATRRSRALNAQRWELMLMSCCELYSPVGATTATPTPSVVAGSRRANYAGVRAGLPIKILGQAKSEVAETLPGPGRRLSSRPHPRIAWPAIIGRGRV